MAKVTVVARAKAQPEKVEELKKELLLLVREVRKEEGCLNYDLHQENANPSTFLFYENWKDMKALETHRTQPHMKAFVSKAKDLLAAPLEVTLCTMVSEPA